MVEENKRATSLNIESPIFDGIELTHENYNNNCKHLITKYLEGYIDLSLYIASHNSHSIKTFGKIVLENKKLQMKVAFGKLMGLGDKEWFEYKALNIFQ